MFSSSLRRVFRPKFSHFETLHSVVPRLFFNSNRRIALLCFGLGIPSFYYVNNYNVKAVSSKLPSSRIGSTTPDSSERDTSNSIVEATKKSLKYLEKKNITLYKTRIYVRPVKDAAALGLVMAIASMGLVGCFHGFIIIDLERFDEGVSVKYLNEKEFKTKIKYCYLYDTFNKSISSYDLATFCHEELRTQYNLATNNCLDFCYWFIRDILDESLLSVASRSIEWAANAYYMAHPNLYAYFNM